MSYQALPIGPPFNPIQSDWTVPLNPLMNSPVFFNRERTTTLILILKDSLMGLSL